MNKTCYPAIVVAMIAYGAFSSVEPLVDAESRWNAKGGYWDSNPDEAKVTPYSLEDPLVFTNGVRMVSPAEWPARRAEILDIFAKKVFGEEPPKPDVMKIDTLSEKVCAGGYATRRICRMSFSNDGSGPAIVWGVWVPRYAKGKCPVIVALTYRGLHELDLDRDVTVPEGWTRNGAANGVENNRASEKSRGKLLDQNGNTVFPLQSILARGYAFVCASYTDVSPDPDWAGDREGKRAFATTNGVFKLWGPCDESRTDNTTSIGAWAWALSRGLDLAGKQKEIDIKRSVVTGCSRLGKAAFLAAARDVRFAVAVPNQCGGGGICLAKRDFGENVSTENAMFPHWYCKAYEQYSPNPAKLMDFDMHLLVAAIAPRRILVEGFGPNVWMDTRGEFLSARAASPAWEFFGVPGLPRVSYPEYYDESAIGPYLGYVRRTEGHGISGFDWKWMLDFADASWKNPYEVQRRITWPIWYKQVDVQQKKVKAAEGRTVDIVLIGDSITWRWESADSGGDVFAQMTNLYSVVNIGVCGDRVEEIDWRCRNGQLDGYRARYAMIFAGTNNIGRETPEEVFEKTLDLIRTVDDRQPQAKILIMSPLPIGRTDWPEVRMKCAKLKSLIKAEAEKKGYGLVDFESRFFEPDGSVREGRRPDGVHFLDYGYRCWFDEIRRLVK